MLNVWVSPAPPSYPCVGDTAIDYTYWPDGQPKTVDDASSFVAYEYDRLNRLTSSSLSSVRSFAVNHKYDGVNLTNSTVSAGGAQASATAYTYDEAERLTGIISRKGAETQSFVYEYNMDNGRIASVPNSVSGKVDLRIWTIG